MSQLQSCHPDHLPLLFTLALWGMPLPVTKLTDFLQGHAQKTSAGTNYTLIKVKDILKQLSLDHVLEQTGTTGFVIGTELKFEALLELQQSGKLNDWIQAVQQFLTSQREYAVWSTPSHAFCQREILFAALTNDVARLVQWRAQFFAFSNTFNDLSAAQFFSTPAGVDLFCTMSGEIQSRLLFDLFSAANWMLEDCRIAYYYATAHIGSLFQHNGTLIEVLRIQAILRGETKEKLDKLFSISTTGKVAKAIRALTQGDFDTSAALFAEEIKIGKTNTGKRKYILPSEVGLFYTLTQLAKNTPANLKLAKEQVDDGCKTNCAHFYPAVKPLLEHLTNGSVLNQRSLEIHFNNLDNLFVSMACYWQDCPATDQLRQHLTHLHTSARQTGYLWVAAEADQLLQHHFGIAPESGHWHNDQGLVPLCGIVQREEAWKRALSALTQLKSSGTTTVTADTRIAWFLECESHYINLEPREQKRSAKGVWSKGRPIALKRLSYEQASLPGIIEQDRKIATCIRKSYDNYYGGSDYELNGETALPFLINHPAVFWMDAPDIRIDIIKGEPALLLKEKNQHISLQLDPDMNADEAVIWRRITPTRLAVYPNTPEIKQIAAIVGNGLTVPASAKTQLVDVIAAIAPHLAIHSDLPELAQHITTINADATLYAHLLPLKEGLRLQFLVRPLPDGGWMVPGKGAKHVLGEQTENGVRTAVQASRDLADELRHLNKTVQHCVALQLAEETAQEWELGHPETCLELLSQLAVLKDQPDSALQLVWPEGERFRIKASRTLNQLRLSIKKQGEWFVAGGELQLDDGRIMALRELLQLAASATGRFLPLGDNQFLAITDSFKKRLNELNALTEPSGKDGIRINPLAAPILAELAAEVDDLRTDAAWKDHIKKLDSLADYQPQLPSTLQATLRDYQLEGFQWLSRLAHWGVGACLADDMGLGKTVQTLAVLLQRAPKGPALVVAPISVAMNWQAEVARFAPTLRVRAYHQNRSLDNLGPFDLVIASYGMLQLDAEAFARPQWHSVVLDEAQLIKNAATKRSQAAMALQADFRIIASGTPVENHLGELWNLFRFINPGLLGSKEQFAERFTNPIERGDKAARTYLKRLIQPFILRRTKTQVLSELPARTEITLQVELSEQERHLYEALRQEALDKLAHMSPEQGKSMQVLAEITKLRRFCCNPGLAIKGSTVAGSKLAVFAEVTGELLENNHKALVFSQFVDHLAIVRQWLEQQGIRYQYLDGSTPALERKKRVDAFQAGEGDVFLISLKAGGTGLNLTAADYVIHLDPWWNPAVEDQASDRAHRIGQARPVTIYRLVAQQTIEEKILALHAEKRDLADSLLEGGDASGKMDTAALLRLLKEGV